MVVLSLFDGMSCGQIACERAGIKVGKYYASEIDKYAIQVTQKNYPETIQLGDITKWKEWDIETPDLIMGGSPCQGFSFAGKQLNFEDPRSKLFFTFVDILKHYKPKYFLLENVRMKKEYQKVISDCLGVEPIEINSSLVSAQNRRRLYWTNIKNVTQPKDKEMVLKHIIEKEMVRGAEITVRFYKKQIGTLAYTKARKNVRKIFQKSKTLTAAGQNISNTGATNLFITPKYVRKLTLVECERLQTVPDNYTNHVSNSQRYKMLGNGWTVDVISHILKAAQDVRQ